MYGTISNLIKKLKFGLMRKFTEIQNKSIKKSGKLELLANTKFNIKYEPYLDELNLDQRKAITQLRISAHKLPIEVGRTLKIPRHKRYCKRCSSSQVGDEFHTLMICPYTQFQTMRSLALDQITKHIPQFSKLPLKEKFMYIFACNDPLCIRIVAPFIARCINHEK